MMNEKDNSLNLAEIVEGCRAVEKLMKEKGAQGKGMSELYKSLFKKLNHYVIADIKSMMHLRNEVVHEDGRYASASEVDAFRDQLKRVSLFLNELPEPHVTLDATLAQLNDMRKESKGMKKIAVTLGILGLGALLVVGLS